MLAPRTGLTPLALAVSALAVAGAARAQSAPAPAGAASAPNVTQLDTVTVRASADASAGGLKAPYAGGQVARGGRVGILGSQDIMDTPFSITNYTQKLIQDQQAVSIGDVLQNDPAVRVARGFGNYQQVYFIRGLPVFSDDMAYNGLYGLLPRQYLAAELVERVEVLRGASAFLNGAAPGGSGLGGAINVSPKRAPNEPLNEITLGFESGGNGYAAVDLARRFGPDNSVGVRLNAVRRDGKTGVDDEKRELSLVSLGLDYRSGNLRVSADLAYQDFQLHGAQPSVTFAGGVPILSAPEAKRNVGQPWTYSTERDTLGTLRAEYDLTRDWTVWGAYGERHGDETNDLANPTVINAAGDMSVLRFTGTRADRISTGEVGVRGKLRTGPVGHTLVLTAQTYRAKMDAPSQFADFAGVATGNLYARTVVVPPPMLFTFPTVSDTRTSSFAIADTLSFLDDALLVTVGARRQSFKDPIANYDESRTTPVGGVVLKVNKMVSIFGSYAEGLVKGDIAPATSGFPAVPVTNAGQVFAPYQTKQGEVGVKLDTGRLGGTFSVFEAKKPSYGVDATNTFARTDEQKNRGVEATFYGEAMPGWRVLGGASWLDAKMQSTGLRSIGAPKSQFTLGTEWDVFGVNGLTIDGRIVNTGSQFADSANTQEVPSWTRLDLGARYTIDIGKQQLTLRARVDNATNRNYWASAGGFPGAGYLVLGTPRTFTLSGTLSF